MYNGVLYLFSSLLEKDLKVVVVFYPLHFSIFFILSTCGNYGERLPNICKLCL